ncbi:MAG: alanyl-tRNA editing protein [Thermoplasmata archaeon]
MTKILYMHDIESNYICEFDAVVQSAGTAHVVLNKTAFYPKGGGQPSDTGVIRWTGGGSKVVKVEKKGKIIHRLEDAPPEVGMEIKGTIDWSPRYEHMKLHTAQHLFSAVVYDMFKGETVGNQIYTDYSRVDFKPVDLTTEDLEKIKQEVNRLIEEAHPVSIYNEKRAVLEEQIEENRVDLSLIPQSIQELRVIDIDGYDICPCAGTHVRNTEEIKGVRITGKENKGKDKQRIYYELCDPDD